MKKMVVLGICLALISSAHAQFLFYKIEKGVKTPLKSGEEIVIATDDNLKATSNVMLEVNVAEFKKKYTYNLFAIGLLAARSGKNEMLMRHPLLFGSEYYTTKFGSDKVLRYYLFPDETTAKDPKALVFYKGDDWYNKFTYEISLDTFLFELEGRYKTGSETYYDENSNSVKTRDVFTDPEYLPIVETPFVRFTTTDKVKQDYQRSLDEQRYKRVIVDTDYSTYYRQGGKSFITLFGIEEELEKESDKVILNYNIGGTGGVILYPQIAKAIQEIGVYKTNQIKAEPDMYKALTMLDEWEINYKKLIIIERLTEDQRKQLNKQLKAAPDAAAKYEIFMTFQ
jgi:hypothetical protein